MPSMPPGVEYVPMSWGYYGADQTSTVNWVTGLKTAGAKEVLAFNEPDNSSQANMTVPNAIQGYSYLSAGSLPVISPAGMDDNDSWMKSFMSSASSAGLNVPAVAVHAYQSTASSFLAYIDGIHNLYNKSLWITEFAPTDWQSPTGVTATDCIRYIDTVIPALQARSYVARYSWYCGTQPGTNVLETAALFNPDNTLTAVGMAYAQPTQVSPLPSGVYKIVSKNSGMALTVLNNQTVNQSSVGQSPFTGTASQEWTLVDLGNGLYKIIGLGSGRALEVFNDNIPNGSAVDIYDYYNLDCMTWYVQQSSPGNFCIIGVGGGKALDVYNSSKTNGGIVDVWSYHAGANQQWQIEPIQGYPQPGNAYYVVNVGSHLRLDSPTTSKTPGTFLDQQVASATTAFGGNQEWIANGVANSATMSFTNVYNGLAIDDYNWSTTTGSQIDEWTYGGGTVQQWSVVPTTSARFQLANQYSGLVLGVTGGSLVGGASIDEETASSANTQQWGFQLVPGWPQMGHAYRLVNGATGMCLDSPTSATVPGTFLDQQTASNTTANGTNQQWLLGPVNGTTYTLTNVFNGLAIDDYGWSTASGTKIDEWTPSGDKVQQWTLTPRADGRFTLTNVASGLVLGVPGGSTVHGASIDQETPTGSTSQAWALQVAYAPISNLSLSQSLVTGGKSVIATVALSFPAPIGGEQITVKGSGLGTATVLIPAGATSGSIAMTAATVTVATSVTVTATVGASTKLAALAITPVTHYLITAPPSVTIGTPFNFTVTALDASNHVVADYPGTMISYTNSAHPKMPTPTTLTSGTKSLSATFTVLPSAGSKIIIAAVDSVASNIRGTSAVIAVAPAPANQISP